MATRPHAGHDDLPGKKHIPGTDAPPAILRPTRRLWDVPERWIRGPAVCAHRTAPRAESTRTAVVTHSGTVSLSMDPEGPTLLSLAKAMRRVASVSSSRASARTAAPRRAWADFSASPMK